MGENPWLAALAGSGLEPAPGPMPWPGIGTLASWFLGPPPSRSPHACPVAGTSGRSVHPATGAAPQASLWERGGALLGLSVRPRCRPRLCRITRHGLGLRLHAQKRWVRVPVSAMLSVCKGVCVSLRDLIRGVDSVTTDYPSEVWLLSSLLRPVDQPFNGKGGSSSTCIYTFFATRCH